MTLKLALALAALCATPAVGADSIFEYPIDERIPLAAEGVMPVSIQAGPVTITEVRVRNMPTERDVAENPTGSDKSHPKPDVAARSSADVKIRLGASLESEEGESYLSCTRKVGLDAGRTDDWSLCGMEGMYTRHWRKVKVVHLVGWVRLDDAAQGSLADAAQALGEGHAVVVHYHRPDGRYKNWGLNVWEAGPGGDVPRPLVDIRAQTGQPGLPPTGQDDFGVYWVFKDTLFADGVVNYVIFRPKLINADSRDEKEQLGGDKSWRLADTHEVWVNSNQAQVYLTKDAATAAQ
ncbi:MAG TPA: pullulanase-associated domain-containing protein [Anaeromyxobacter sp.]|nr:pullulanase-associated domain-containing protein [Thermoanaerobaculaceae bacterium]HVO21192.1 pullulanase-associated domain-containing protein [Anaeromyxobacter sp.]